MGAVAAAAVAAAAVDAPTPVVDAAVVDGAAATPVLVAVAADTPALAAVASDAAEAASSSGAVLVAVVAEGAAAAAGPAGYGRQAGDGSTAAGRTLHQRLRYLLSHQSNPLREWRVSRKVTGISRLRELNSAIPSATASGSCTGRDPPRLVAHDS